MRDQLTTYNRQRAVFPTSSSLNRGPSKFRTLVICRTADQTQAAVVYTVPPAMRACTTCSSDPTRGRPSIVPTRVSSESSSHLPIPLNRLSPFGPQAMQSAERSHSRPLVKETKHARNANHYDACDTFLLALVVVFSSSYFLFSFSPSYLVYPFLLLLFVHV